MTTRSEDDLPGASAERRRGRADGISASAVVVFGIGAIAWISVGRSFAPVLLFLAIVSLCMTIAAVWTAWDDYDKGLRHAGCPSCPYCPPRKLGAISLALPASIIMAHGRWAWCGRCGAHYRHADRSWTRPTGGDPQPYRDPAELEDA